MALRNFKCPACGTQLAKSDMLFLLSQAHEEPQARITMTSPPSPVICPACRTSIPAERIVAGAYDVAPPPRPTEPPTLGWVMFSPVIGALAGGLGFGLLINLPAYLIFGISLDVSSPNYSFGPMTLILIAFVLAGSVWAFKTNLDEYRRGKSR